MQWIDTHTHLYLDQFDADRDDMLQRAFSAGITKLLLPNIDAESIAPLLKLCKQYPEHCFPMMGLHPTSVDENVQTQLNLLEQELLRGNYIGIGEIGIDLYWDKTFLEEQIHAFRTQLNWAKEHALPVAIHTREAFPLILDLVEEAQDGRLKGVFHCFTGNAAEAERIMKLGFYMGIGGVLTYKKSHLPEIVQNIPLDFLLLETDSPYLPPVPYRGKRNESSYLTETALKLAAIKQIPLNELAEITTKNAHKLFNIHIL
ncbi:MAG: TatD family hydrolase [Bacteroidales bacterium]|nr:TatD family hydrolase [Bacteroidales bacterium]